MPIKTFQGGCHCGAVKYSVEVLMPETGKPLLHYCNCSVCSMTGYLHLIVPKAQFHLEQGEENLSLYQFNKKIAKHYFCKTCGVKSFYVPRSNPDGISVNARCLDANLKIFDVDAFDGQNWEASAEQLKDLT
ncbi:MAG: GFA family protein [Gammaproteobacteria bacterium]|nr:GFA family protein [Gammaproteobacteria bacterium]